MMFIFKDRFVYVVRLDLNLEEYMNLLLGLF